MTFTDKLADSLCIRLGIVLCQFTFVHTHDNVGTISNQLLSLVFHIITEQ